MKLSSSTSAVLLAGRAIAAAPSPELQTCLQAAVEQVEFSGSLFYEELFVQPYNLDINTIPAAVTSPTNASQVAAIVKCASTYGYPVQAKAGGHSYANYGLGGTNGSVVVNMQYFQQFSLDPTTYQAKIGSGTLLAQVTQRLNDAGGRAMSHGTAPQVGAGGHFTIGGLGPTSRQFGTSLDHIVGVEVVLANSSIVYASEDEYPDIFFAIRGAAAGFGIVTEFTVRTEPAPGSAVQYSISFTHGDVQTRVELFEKWQAYVTQPNLTWKLASTLSVSSDEIVIDGTYFGTKAEYDALGIQESFPGSNNASETVWDDWLGLVGHWAEGGILALGGGVPAHFYSKCGSFTPRSLLSTTQISDMFNYLETTDAGTVGWFVLFDLQGGATNQVPVSSTAYASRDTIIWLQSYAIVVPGPVPETTFNFLDGVNQIAFVNNATEAPYLAYPGYVDPRLTNPQEAYWGTNLPRLEMIKAEIDPDNLFSNPQSVRGVSNSS